MKSVTISPPPKPTKKQLIIRWVIYGVIIVAFSIALLLIFWTVQSNKVLDVKNSPFPVRPNELAQEDIINVHVEYCKLSDAHGNVITRLVGHKSIIRLPWPDDTQPARCVDTWIAIPIPAYANDDRYHFEFEVDYHINPIKTQSVVMESQEFTVKAP